MDIEELIKDIADAEHVPDEALRALAAHATALAPRIEALARRRLEGAWLYPGEENVLFYGLFILAASKTSNFWPTWVELLTRSEDRLEALFGDGAVHSVCAITLGLVADRSAEVADLILDKRISNDARGGLVEALTRLMCEGAYPRLDFVAMIDALSILEGTENDDHCKWMVEDAIVLGGIEERRELLEQFWRTEAFSIWNDADRTESRALLSAAASAPQDMRRFDGAAIAASADPVDALRWLKAIEAYTRVPGQRVTLSWRERAWLDALLHDPSTSVGAMCFESLDGFFHALVIGPELVLPSEYLIEIWGEGPKCEDAAQIAQAMGLLQRHWNAIARRQETEPALIWLEPHDDHLPGQAWAKGFARGVELRASAWMQIMEDEDAAAALDQVLALRDEDLDLRERAGLLRMLGDNFAELAEFWQAARMRRQPLRARKVGRNDPCPCGSGKKWKKCCGAAPSPVVH